ncbi:hypothetical protein AAIB33_10915 [Microbacterium sp. AZCO]|uniref:hypothetical protein n=1 Tax=Microbacterium sp. AZCO TaxID=3142976 RepID=UPI0031F36CE9
MSGRDTIIRSLQDVGLAGWFGGSLMGAIGLNGGAATASSPAERLTISSAGWARWAPVQWALIGAHALGGIALIFSNKERLATQGEARTNTIVKTCLELAAGAVTVYSGFLGMKMAKNAPQGTEGVTEPADGASTELTSAQKQQKVLQWVIPTLTAVLLVLGAQQGEQQRPVAGRLKGKADRLAALTLRRR